MHILPHEAWIRRLIKRQALAAALEVDDVVQEMYSVLVQMRSVETITHPPAYAVQIARSLVLQHVRRAKIVSMERLTDHNILECTYDAPTPEQHALGRSELLRVTAAIDAMPDVVRRAFWMRRVEGIPQREIARQLCISENTIEKQISRGIKILVDSFARDGDDRSRASTGNEFENGSPAQDDPARVGREHQ